MSHQEEDRNIEQLQKLIGRLKAEFRELKYAKSEQQLSGYAKKLGYADPLLLNRINAARIDDQIYDIELAPAGTDIGVEVRRRLVKRLVKQRRVTAAAVPDILREIEQLRRKPMFRVRFRDGDDSWYVVDKDKPKEVRLYASAEQKYSATSRS